MNVQNSLRGSMVTGQSAAIRGGAAAIGKPKKSFASKLGGFMKGVAQVGLGVAGQVIPGASILSQALGGAGFGGGGAGGLGNFSSSAGVGQTGNNMMQDMMAMNMQFMALQQRVQQESQRFQTLSNVLRSKHDVAMNSIRNAKA
jgi:hypothetical protein